MSHELYRDPVTGKVAFSYVGQAGWHGLGTMLTPNAPLSVWKQEAGFDWEIRQGDCCTLLTDDTAVRMPERQLLFRSDTLAPLAVVSDKYKVVQPLEVLHFYEDLIDTAGFKLETAGIMFGGRRFWALAATNYSDEVLAGDRVSQYLLLTTACDGSLATTAKFTPVRVVCNNTLSMALSRDGNRQQIKVPHSANFDPQAVKRSLGVAGETWDNFMEDARRLASIEMSRMDASQFLINLLGDPTKSAEDQPVAAANQMQQIYQLWDRNSMGNELVGHTAWGMYNSVTEFADWHTGHKTADARMDSAWFGTNAKIKDAAFDLLLATA